MDCTILAPVVGQSRTKLTIDTTSQYAAMIEGRCKVAQVLPLSGTRISTITSTTAHHLFDYFPITRIQNMFIRETTGRICSESQFLYRNTRTCHLTTHKQSTLYLLEDKREVLRGRQETLKR
jgi:hypothetical protein